MSNGSKSEYLLAKIERYSMATKDDRRKILAILKDAQPGPVKICIHQKFDRDKKHLRVQVETND